MFVAAAVVAHGLGLRAAQGSRLHALTEAAAVPNVAVVTPSSADNHSGLELPGRLEAYIRAPIYARVPGYLKSWSHDIGSRVQAGDVLAEIDTPDLDQQLSQARADLNVAQANAKLAEITAKRWQSLAGTDAVATQDVDQRNFSWNANVAQVKAAKANVDRLVAEESFKHLIAPFDGIVTARYVDPGALVAQTTTPTQSYLLSHTSENATPMVMLATLRPLRVYASAPQNIANFIYDGGPATISVEQRPGKDIAARVTRHPRAMDPSTRLMLVEADLPNSDGALYPGMYGTMSLTVNVPGSAPLVSDDALIFRDDKVLVPVVRNSVVHLAQVTLGYDNGYAVEATSGISRNDLIAMNLGQSATEGERVQPIQQTADAKEQRK